MLHKNVITTPKSVITTPGKILLMAIFYILAAQPALAQGVQFSHSFAPQQGMISELEMPQREEICLNGYWQFMPVKLPENISFEEIKSPDLPSQSGWEEIPLKVPSPWNVNGFTNGQGGDFRAFPGYPEAWNDVKSGWLKKTIRVPANWSGNRVVLHFEAVAGYTKIFMNGKQAGEHFDSFLPFKLDVTELLTPGEDAEILVWVAHGSLLNDPGKYGRRNYVAGSFWGIFIAGIWQDVYLQKYPDLYITDTYIRPWVDRDLLEVEVTVRNTRSKPLKFALDAAIQRWINLNGKSGLSIPEVNWKLGEEAMHFSLDKLEIGPGEEKTYLLSTPVNGALDLWSPDSPNLYGLVLSVNGKKEILDTDYTRFGWRQFDIQGTALLLNGEPIQIRGDSWHFMGVPQMTRRYAYAWYQALLDANANGVRLHAQVFPRFYLEMADEMGICILDETAIWSSDGGPKIDSDIYWQACRTHVRGMVLRDRNHPSVMGWSVCNETLPVTKHVFNAPDSLVERNIAEINKWVVIVQETDPTRTWISGDGETQAETDLPTVIGHYGGPRELIRWSGQGKPWGIGETGMAYYGTPAQVAKINGDRAYESQLGRMEGLAGEAFDLISMQRDYNASYTSVFNLAWYGLKPLPLGLQETSRAPEMTDGIFFPAFREGQPGYQPERLGSYTSTFNPGYDPTLPLYAPWPLFDAIKMAFSDQYKTLENRWDKKKDNTVRKQKSTEKEGMVWLGSGEGNLKRQFEEMAILFEPFDPGQRQLIIVDGSHPPASTPELLEELQSAIQNGSVLLFWGADQSAGELVTSLTGSEVVFYDRNATSYLIRAGHPMLNGQSNATLYFTELTKTPVSTHTLGGEWVQDAQVLLEASGTDWSKWNYQPEDVKTAMVYRNEMEKKSPGTVIARQPNGEGALIVSTVDFFSMGQQSRFLVRNLISNMGGVFQAQIQDLPPAIDKEGVLRNANYYGTVKIDSREIELLFENAPLEEEEFMQVHVGTLTNGAYWDTLSASEEGVFDFLSQPVKHRNYASCYLSFWIYSPRSLTDLLIEPDMPRLDMFVGVDDLLAFSVNGTPVSYYIGESGFVEDEFKYEGLPLEKGWNHMLIKVAQDTGDWKCKISFSSTRPGFMQEIKAVADR